LFELQILWRCFKHANIIAPKKNVDFCYQAKR
jgi:hypothetical protein